MDIDNRVSTRIKETTLAQWGLKDGQYRIVLNLAGCWSEAVDIIDRWRGYAFLEEIDEPERWPAYDKYIDAFCDSLACSYLMERICIERSREKIRLNRNHCKPCCLEGTVISMHNHVHHTFIYTAVEQRHGDNRGKQGNPGKIVR